MEDFVNRQGAVNGFDIIREPIGQDQIREAITTLNKYKEGKKNLEQRIIDNEQWYKLRHWECMRDRTSDVQPTSAWLFNCIANKHADAMDSFPEPNILPREEGDKAEAEKLSSIIPVILDQNDFEQVYSDFWNYKLKMGTGVYGIFWDKSKLNGLGDISIQKIDLINLFWESGITDIQKSRNLFHIELADNDLLEQEYPELVGKLSNSTVDVKKYIYDDAVDTSNKSAVVDWYYRKNNNGRTVLHYCKFVNDVVLFATENEPNYKDRGWYDHGKYPFVFDTLFPVEGTPTGFGYIDIGKDPQMYIDRGNQAIMKSMLVNAKPRYFIKNTGAVNEEDFANLDKELIPVDGNLTNDTVMPVVTQPLNSIYLSVLQDKVNELKETTGNRDVSSGGTTSGVTAASAIAAMQEAGSKLSRDSNKSAYRAYRRLITMVIELIRQFYDLPRCFRILGENGTARFIQYSNENIKPVQNEELFGEDMGIRLPLFDVQVTAQKQSPYSKLSQNELAMQFYQSGFFNPQLADQALICLDMMDFDRKEFVSQKIAQNGTMYQQMMMMQQQMLALAGMVDHQRGNNDVQNSLFSQFGINQQLPNMPDSKDVKTSQDESGVTKNAREKVASSTSP